MSAPPVNNTAPQLPIVVVRTPGNPNIPGPRVLVIIGPQNHFQIRYKPGSLALFFWKRIKKHCALPPGKMLLIYNGLEMDKKYSFMPTFPPRAELYVSPIVTRTITITVSFPSLNIPSLTLQVKSYRPCLEYLNQIKLHSRQFDDFHLRDDQQRIIRGHNSFGLFRIQNHSQLTYSI